MVEETLVLTTVYFLVRANIVERPEKTRHRKIENRVRETCARLPKLYFLDGARIIPSES